MKAERFIAARIADPQENKGNISRPIVKIGIIGIATGVAVMLLTVSIVLGFKKEIVNRITGLTTHLVMSSTSLNSSNEPIPVRLSPDSLNTIAQMPFVESVQPVAFKNGLLKTENENEGILLKGVGQEYDFSFLGKYLSSGRLPEFKPDEASKDILVSEALSSKLNLKVDEKILVYFIVQHDVYDSTAQEMITRSEQRSRKFNICGIFNTNFADFDNKLSLIDLRQIQKLNYWDSSMVGSYEVRVRNFSKVEEAVEEIQDYMGYNFNVSSVKALYSNIFVWLDKLDINGVIIVVLMVIVATINMITALLILILERTNMIGLVKALGMSNHKVRSIFVIVSMRLTGRGLLWGNIVGISLCLIQYYFKIARLDSDTYYVDHVALDINWGYFLLLNVATFVVCALMLLVPTVLVTRLTPVKTLKFD